MIILRWWLVFQLERQHVIIEYLCENCSQYVKVILNVALKNENILIENLKRQRLKLNYWLVTKLNGKMIEKASICCGKI